MNDTTATPPVDDIWMTKNPELQAGRGYAWSPQAKSLTGPHGILRIATFMLIALQVGAIAVIAAMMYLFLVLANGEYVEGPLAGLFGAMVEIGGSYLPIASIVVLIGCVIAYLMFVYRAIKNLHLANSRQVSTSPAWAVGWSFIPLANLFMIFDIMKQIWTASHDPITGKYTPPFTIYLWWGCWIASGIVGRVSEAIAPREQDLVMLDATEYLGAFTPSTAIATVSGLLSIASCIFLLGLIRQITTAQETLRSTAAFDE